MHQQSPHQISRQILWAEDPLIGTSPADAKTDAKRPSSERSQGLKPAYAAPSQERTKQPTGLRGGGWGVTASPETRGPGGPAPGVVAAGDGVHRPGPGESAARLPPGLAARPGLIPTSLPGRPAPAPRAGRRGSGGGWSIGRAAHTQAWAEGPVSASAPRTCRHNANKRSI